MNLRHHKGGKSGSPVGTWAQGPGAVFVTGRVGGNITVTVTTERGRFERLASPVQNPGRLSRLYELDRFTGRDMAIAKINKALARQRRGYILIEGPAGVGKSTLVAQLVKCT